MTTMRGLMTLAGALVMAGGCISVIPDSGPAPDTYRLSAPAVTDGETPRSDWIVEVPAPTALRALSSDRIALTFDEVRLAYAADARWAAGTPVLVQSLLIETFDASGRVAAAARPEDGLPNAFELRLDIQTFEAAYRGGPDNPPTARLAFGAKLVDTRTRALVASRLFRAERPAEDTALDAVVAAIDGAAHELAARLVAWTVAEGDRYRAGDAEPAADA